jgi:hypothetical protein
MSLAQGRVFMADGVSHLASNRKDDGSPPTSPSVDIELDALGLVGDRAESFIMGPAEVCAPLANYEVD